MKKIGSFFDKAWTWLVMSSANPSQYSLTVKGFFGTAISVIIALFGIAHIQIVGLPDILNTIVDQVVLIIQYGLGIVGALSVIIGAIRKVWVGIKALLAFILSKLPSIQKPTI